MKAEDKPDIVRLRGFRPVHADVAADRESAVFSAGMKYDPISEAQEKTRADRETDNGRRPGDGGFLKSA